jgi:CRP/FNR family transcriptional regulator, anaerobic regulatory protein
MNVAAEFPIVVTRTGAPPSCATCGVRRASVCDAIPEADLGRLTAAAMEGVAKPNETITEEAGPATAFFNVTSGTVRLYKLLPDGRRQITGFATKGDFIGLAASGNYAATAEAIDTVRYCRFSHAKLRALIHDTPTMETQLLNFATAALATAHEQMLLLGRKSARERVASFLMIRSRLSCAHRQSATHFILPMARGDIADYLGMTIETVVRTLKKLRDEGMIEVANTRDVVITDYISLRRLADGLARCEAGRD